MLTEGNIRSNVKVSSSNKKPNKPPPSPSKKENNHVILKSMGYLHCGECDTPLLSDFDHIRCANPECRDRGKKYKYPKIALEEY